MAVRVLIVDDSLFFRNRLAEIIARDPQLEVIGTAQNGEQAITQVKRLRPDVQGSSRRRVGRWCIRF